VVENGRSRAASLEDNYHDINGIYIRCRPLLVASGADSKTRRTVDGRYLAGYSQQHR